MATVTYGNQTVALSPEDYQTAVREHAKYLGMDPDNDADLMW